MIIIDILRRLAIQEMDNEENEMWKIRKNLKWQSIIKTNLEVWIDGDFN